MKKIQYLNVFIISFLILSCSQSEPIALEDIITNPSVENLINHSQEFQQNIYSYEDGIHAAIGFGIANSYLIEGKEFNIIIDATDSIFQAKKVLTEFKKINSNPIAAIIYTHNHGDHTLGAQYFADQQEETPLVIAHDLTAASVEKIFGILNPIISRRSSKMFGTALPEEDVINVGIGPYLSVGKSAPGYLKPNVTFQDRLNLNIAGIEFEFFHAPGETDDQIFVWLPEYSALFPGDNVYKTFPNLYTIRGTSHRDVNAWISSLDRMIDLNPAKVFPSHTQPFFNDAVKKNLTIYRDGIQFVHDQTVRLMNLGFDPEEIIEQISLPQNIASSPFFNEFYGTVRWSVKSIFNGYLGWFTGNISELDPTSTRRKAELMSDMIGGLENLYHELEKAVNGEEMQWALELSDLLLALNHRTKEVNALRAQAAYFIGKMSSNPNKRNYFLSEAQILRDGENQSLDVKPKASMLEEVPIDMFFEVLSVRLNPKKVKTSEVINACFTFSSGATKVITIRNQIAQITNQIPENCNLKINSSEAMLKQVLAGLRNPVTAIASQDIMVDKNVEFIKFLSRFTP